MKEHFKPFGNGWYIIYLILFFTILLLSFLSLWSIITDKQISYVCIVFMVIAMVEGFLGLKEEYKDVHRSVNE